MQIKVPQTFGDNYQMNINYPIHNQRFQQSTQFNLSLRQNTQLKKSPLQQLLSEFIPDYEHQVQQLEGERIIGYQAISELRDKSFPQGKSDYVDKILMRNAQNLSSEIVDESEPYEETSQRQIPQKQKPRKQNNSKYDYLSEQIIQEFENLSIQPQKFTFNKPQEQSQINIFQDKDVKNIFSFNDRQVNEKYKLLPPTMEEEIQPIQKDTIKSKMKKQTERISQQTQDESQSFPADEILNQTCLSLRQRKPKFDLSSFIADENEKHIRQLPKESRFSWNDHPLRDNERRKEKYKQASIKRLIYLIPHLYILPSEGSIQLIGDGISFMGKLCKLKFDLTVKPNQHIGPTQIEERCSIQIQVFGGNSIQVDQQITTNTIIREILHISNPSKKAVKVSCEIFFPL